MKPKVLILATIVVCCAAVWPVLSWRNSLHEKAMIASSIPELPSLAGVNSALTERLQDLDTKIRSEPNQEDFEKLGQLYHANGYLREAWQVYVGLISIDDNNPMWPHLLANIVSGYGRLNETIPLYKKAILIDPTYIASQVKLGIALIKLNLFDEAKAVSEKTLERFPENPYVFVNLGRIAIAAEDWVSAIVYLEKAAQYSSNRIGGDLLADTYEKVGQRMKARDLLQQNRYGNFSDIPDPWQTDLMFQCYDAFQVSMAGGKAQHGLDIDLAIRLMQRAVSLEPDNAIIQFQMGDFYYKKGDFADAKQSFSKSVEIMPDLADAWIGIILIDEATQNSASAKANLRRALLRAPDSPALNIRMGSELLATNQIEQAIIHFSKAIEQQPNEAGGYINLAHAYFLQNSEEAGIEQTNKALLAEPGNPLALTTMARFAISNGDKAKADEYLQRSVDSSRVTKKSLEELITSYKKAFGANPTL